MLYQFNAKIVRYVEHLDYQLCDKEEVPYNEDFDFWSQDWGSTERLQAVVLGLKEASLIGESVP
jgi:hypothetical protein